MTYGDRVCVGVGDGVGFGVGTGVGVGSGVGVGGADSVGMVVAVVAREGSGSAPDVQATNAATANTIHAQVTSRVHVRRRSMLAL